MAEQPGKDLHDRLPLPDIGGGMDPESFFNALKWDSHGLVTVVTQDVETREVLGVAFTNRDALRKTLETGRMHYYSRSRNKLWLKGEVSGHFQFLKTLRADCDGDALLASVQQIEGNCHLGYRSCFNLEIEAVNGRVNILPKGQMIFDPRQVYKKRL